jgi:hypothetical protein
MNKKSDETKEYYEDYCMNGDPGDITITIDSDTQNTFDVSNIFLNDISLDWSDLGNSQRNLVVEGDVVIKNHGEDPIDVYDTIREQTLQIEALTDMIQEMVKKKDFNIDWDLNKRVDQKRFLQKLSKDA